MELLEEFETKKRAGGGLLTLGILCNLGAITLGAVSGVKSAEGEDGQVYLLVGGLTELIGAFFLISGISLIVKGNRGIKNAKENFYDPEDPLYAQRRATKLLPGMDATPLKAQGVSLKFRF